MVKRRLGRSELLVSPFCLGTMNFGKMVQEKDAHDIIQAAYSRGVNFINVADFDYGETSQRIIGTAFSNYLNRRDIVLSVEICGKDMGVPYNPNLTKDYIKGACDKALTRLRTDYIDLYNVPRPNANIPIQETLEALAELKAAGKIRYYGCSTFPAWMVMESIFVAKELNINPFLTEQPPYNLLERRVENELIPLAQKYEMGIIPWAPLAQGVLTGRYRNIDELPSDSRAVKLGGIYRERVTQKGIEAWYKMNHISEETGFTSAQIAYLWIKDRPCVVAPIVGVRNCCQLNELLDVADESLRADILSKCDEVNPEGTAVADFYNTAPWMKMRIN